MAAKTVLVVDDTAAHLQQIKEIVAGAGYQVITATSGREAVERARADLPDMIFLDIVMDDLDGYGACREITRDESTGAIPVVCVVVAWPSRIASPRETTDTNMVENKAARPPRYPVAGSALDNRR